MEVSAIVIFVCSQSLSFELPVQSKLSDPTPLFACDLFHPIVVSRGPTCDLLRAVRGDCHTSIDMDDHMCIEVQTWSLLGSRSSLHLSCPSGNDKDVTTISQLGRLNYVHKLCTDRLFFKINPQKSKEAMVDPSTYSLIRFHNCRWSVS